MPDPHEACRTAEQGAADNPCKRLQLVAGHRPVEARYQRDMLQRVDDIEEVEKAEFLHLDRAGRIARTEVVHGLAALPGQPAPGARTRRRRSVADRRRGIFLAHMHTFHCACSRKQAAYQDGRLFNQILSGLTIGPEAEEVAIRPGLPGEFCRASGLSLY